MRGLVPKGKCHCKCYKYSLFFFGGCGWRCLHANKLHVLILCFVHMNSVIEVVLKRRTIFYPNAESKVVV